MQVTPAKGKRSKKGPSSKTAVPPFSQVLSRIRQRGSRVCTIPVCQGEKPFVLSGFRAVFLPAVCFEPPLIQGRHVLKVRF